MHSKRARFPPDVPTSKKARKGQASASTEAVGRKVDGLPEGMRGKGDTASATTNDLGEAGGGVPERTRGRRLGDGVAGKTSFGIKASSSFLCLMVVLSKTSSAHSTAMLKALARDDAADTNKGNATDNDVR